MSVREVKVCLLGDVGVGKTSLVGRFVHDTFSQNITTTLGYGSPKIHTFVSLHEALFSRRTQLLKLFKDANYEDSVRLLPYIENLKQLRDEVTIKISPFDAYPVKASLLHMASWNGWLDVAGDLITKYDCDPEEKDSKGNTCLHYAAMGNHVDVMVYFIEEFSCDPVATNEDGDTVLHKAAYYGSLDVMKNFKCNPKSTNKKDETLLHCAVEHVDILKYLIHECSCDPMANTSDGRTPLHYAANYGHSASVEFLLSTGKCDPLAKGKDGKTPLRLAKERQQRGGTNTLPIFKKFGNIKSSHPIDSYVNVFLVGNPGAGKSTLSHVINDTTSFTLLGSFRNVGGVVPCTAGIIPYKLRHRTLGNIILHDFAGHSEYYSSHSAVIENLLQGSGGVFLIVVNILEKEAVKQLHQWLTVVRNEAQKALNQCHIIIVVSHIDKVSNPVERKRKEKMQDIIVRERASFMSKSLTVDNSTIKFQIWDTAGQERYRSLLPMYYRNAAAAIVVYDITNEGSFTVLQDWIAELHRLGPPNIVLAIAGNKCDLEDKREV
uniref:Uncharacterized protein n=1 Tax=Amphimedon queenslandica TaxID=400682 RepID=A0A1X7U9P4_AMPQE